MPEAEKIKVFILHAPEDNQGKYEGRLAHFSKFLKGAFHQNELHIRYAVDFLAGVAQDEVRQFAGEADLFLVVISADFFNDAFCLEMLEQMRIWRKRRGQKQILLYYRAFSAYKMMNELKELSVFPLSDKTVEIEEQNLDACFDEIGMAIAEQYAASPSNKPQTLSPEKQVEQSETLLKALNRLNYHKQPIHFKNLTLFQEEVLPAAFLLHGQLKVLGADWLIAKLLSQLPDGNPRIIRTSVDRADFNIEENGFMGDIGKKLGLGSAASYAEMKEGMLQLLRKSASTIVLRFDAMRNLLASTELTAFQDFRKLFWDPLVAELKIEAAHPESRLIAIFVAHEDMETCQHFDAFPPAERTMPVRLPKVAHFDAALINDWLDNHGEILAKLPGKQPKDLIQYQTRPAKIAEILSKSQNGLPEMVLQHICRECACDFEDILKMLAKHEAEN